jgi:cytochrome c-type biogenesis protein CcmH
VLVSLALVCLAAAAPLAAIEPLEFKDRAEEQRYQKLLRELRCLQCQNQSLADSDANVAGGLRQEIHRQMQAGKSNEEIKAFLVDRYGEFVLYRPEVKGGTMLLWFGPFVILALGGAALLVHLRRRAAAAPAALAAASASNRSEEDW